MQSMLGALLKVVCTVRDSMRTIVLSAFPCRQIVRSARHTRVLHLLLLTATAHQRDSKDPLS